MIRYFPTAGDKHGWAIDEDRRLIRSALEGTALESRLFSADVVHAPFWMALGMHCPAVLRRRFVIAHADNPPFFYLTQPAFARGQGLVDLWVARSSEALGQFQALGLEAEHIPYAIDESLFFPIADKKSLRAKYGLPENAYVIGNFHRDSEGADLCKPKLQKAPEMVVAILRRVRDAGIPVHVLLAGPRRHWIRAALREEGIPFTFVGREDPAGDDFGLNILSRQKLNELYNACDLYLIPSRWEGGPQSVMEAAAARTKMLSIPLGVGRDILEPASMFDLASEASDFVVRDAKDGYLGVTLAPQEERLHTNHTSSAMARGLRRLYESLGARRQFAPVPENAVAMTGSVLSEVAWELRRRAKPARLPESVRILHASGRDAFLDEAVSNLKKVLSVLGIRIAEDDATIVFAGCADGDVRADYRILGAGGFDSGEDRTACRVALSVQDAVNFKQAGHQAPVVVCPLLPDSPMDCGEGHFLVAEDDANSSADVWRAMISRRVPVYPARQHYYWQVFHGGVSYGERRTKESAIQIAGREAAEIISLGRPPAFENAVGFFRGLLAK